MTGKLKVEMTYENMMVNNASICETQMLNIWETLTAVGVEKQTSWGQHGVSSLTLFRPSTLKLQPHHHQ